MTSEKGMAVGGGGGVRGGEGRGGGGARGRTCRCYCDIRKLMIMSWTCYFFTFALFPCFNIISILNTRLHPELGNSIRLVIIIICIVIVVVISILIKATDNIHRECSLISREQECQSVRVAENIFCDDGQRLRVLESHRRYPVPLEKECECWNRRENTR